MKALLGGAITFILIVVVSLIGVGIVEQSRTITAGVVGTNTTLMNVTYASGGSAITTLMQILPLVALALGGGIAIFYLMSSFGGQTQGK
jgi:hypothetical protein